MTLHTIFFNGHTATLHRRTDSESAPPQDISRADLAPELQSSWDTMSAGLNGLLVEGESLVSCEVNRAPDAAYEWAEVEVDDGDGGTTTQQQPTEFRSCVRVTLQIRTDIGGIRRVALASEEFTVPQVRAAVIELWKAFE
jgi:hypothetical protein